MTERGQTAPSRSEASPAAASEPWAILGQRPLLLSCVGGTLLGLTGVLFHVSGASPATATTFRCVYALPLIWLFAAYERRRGGSWSGSRPLAWLAGALLAADLVLWQRSVQDVGAGLATVLGNSQLVFVVLVSALVLGERITARVAIAIGAMMVGIVLISGALEENPYGAEPLRGAAYAVAAGALYAAYILLLRRASGGAASVAPLLHATLGAALAAVLLGLALDELALTPSWPAHGWLLLLAVLGQAVAWLLLTVPISRLPASATSLALTLQPVSGVIYGALLLSERPSPLQLAGVAVVLAGFVAAVRGRASSPPARLGDPGPREYARSHA